MKSYDEVARKILEDRKSQDYTIAHQDGDHMVVIAEVHHENLT